MPKPEEQTTPEIDPIAELSKKVDSLTKLVNKLMPKEDAAPKVDPQIEKAEKAMRGLLKDRVNKDSIAKLDTLNLAELSLAAELLPIAKIEVGNDIPKGKTDTAPLPFGAGTDVSKMLAGGK